MTRPRPPRIPMGFWSLLRIADPPSEHVDQYLTRLPEREAAALDEVRGCVLTAAPVLEESMMLGFPTFQLHGRTVAGMAVAARDLMYLPFSPLVVAELTRTYPELRCTSSAIHFSADAPLPAVVVELAVRLRMAQLQDA